MTDALKQARDALPPLPEPAGVGMLIDYRWEGAPSLDPRAAHPHVSVSVPAYTADQMREYARAAIARADAAPRDDGMPASADERHLRRLLAIRVGMPHTYTDDGEANGQQHDIAIDFMREPVADIDAKLRALNVARAECADAAQAAPVAQSDEFYWLVELFLPGGGNSLGKYHTGFATLHGTSRSTEDVYKAKRYATKAEAEAAANRLESLRGVWHAVEHGFAAPPAPAAQEPEELSPEFTDTARAALLWVLWHHQGGSSPVGQPIRFALGMGAHERLNEHQIAEAKRWAGITKSTTNDFHQAAQQEPAQAVPFTGAQTAATTLVRVLVEPAQADARWTPMHERAPEPDTECVVILRYSMDRPPFASVDRWEMYREDPTGMGGPTLEMGYGWRDNYEADVIAWMPIPAHPPEDWDQRLEAAQAKPAGGAL